MRVLYIPSTLPWPPDDGERVRCHHLIRELAGRVKLTVACPLAKPEGEIPKPLQKADWRFFASDGAGRMARLGCSLRLEPVFYRSARSTSLLDWLESLDMGSFDAVHLDGLPALHYRDLAGRVARTTVFDLRDSWSLLYGRRIAVQSSAAMRIKKIAVERLERRVLDSRQPITLVSAVDRDHIIRHYRRSAAGLDVVPNGVALELLSLPGFQRFAERPLIVFTGAMNYPPNDEAARWFAEQVMPALRARVSGVRFAVVGKQPSVALRSLTSDDIVVTGEVASVAEWLGRADIVVAPLRTGSGIKNKVLESLAAARPTVASPIAVEGIEIAHGREVIIADGALEWVDAIAGLLSAPARAVDLAAAGRLAVRGVYDWSAAAERYIALYQSPEPSVL
jgi:glycosyltransferase involved in cell wall biosynthesis